MQIPSDILQQSWFIAGPTATGKSVAGIELALKIGGELISMDSMAIYRRMDLGTAKPDTDQQRIVRHHLIDVLDPDGEYSVADYVSDAHAACRQILEDGKTPIFVGGTGLYLRALLRGVFDGPPADPEFRSRLETIVATDGVMKLHQLLSECDPEAALRLHPNDTRRVIRAIEVAQLTGRPISDQQRQAPLPSHKRPEHVFWLSPPRDWLYERINNRVDDMIARGLLEEVHGLMSEGGSISHTARQALGYKEMIEHIEGKSTLALAVEQIKTRTRQFAKRQHTWFRNLEECVEIKISGDEAAEEIAARLWTHHDCATGDI